MARGARVYHIGLHEAALCGGLRHRFPGMAGRDKDIDPASELAEEDEDVTITGQGDQTEDELQEDFDDDNLAEDGDLNDADRDAIAVYIKSLPARESPPKPAKK